VSSSTTIESHKFWLCLITYNISASLDSSCLLVLFRIFTIRFYYSCKSKARLATFTGSWSRAGEFKRVEGECFLKALLDAVTLAGADVPGRWAAAAYQGLSWPDRSMEQPWDRADSWTTGVEEGGSCAGFRLWGRKTRRGAPCSRRAALHWHWCQPGRHSIRERSLRISRVYLPVVRRL